MVKLAARDVNDDEKNKAWLQRAEAACDAALDADPRNSKARYRLAQTLAALGDERLGEAIAAARCARRSIIDEKAGDAQRGAVADLLLALLDRDKATNDKTSRIARGLLRARRGGKGHEMTRGWKKPGTGEKKKAAVQKGFMDPKPRDYASSDDELVVEDVTKPLLRRRTRPIAMKLRQRWSTPRPIVTTTSSWPCARPKMTNGRRGGRPGLLPRRTRKLLKSRPKRPRGGRRASAHPEDERELSNCLIWGAGLRVVPRWGFACGWCLVGQVAGFWERGRDVRGSSKIVRICGVFASTRPLPRVGLVDGCARASTMEDTRI